MSDANSENLTSLTQRFESYRSKKLPGKAMRLGAKQLPY
jgi:hypothetical protein